MPFQGCALPTSDHDNPLNIFAKTFSLVEHDQFLPLVPFQHCSLHRNDKNLHSLQSAKKSWKYNTRTQSRRTCDQICPQLNSKLGRYAQDVAVISSGILAINGGLAQYWWWPLVTVCWSMLLRYLSRRHNPIIKSTDHCVMPRPKKSKLFVWQT